MASETAIMSIKRFQTFPIIFLRIVGVVAWIASYIGTCVAFNGGWERTFVFDMRWTAALVGGIIYQTAFSLGQIGCKSRAKNIAKTWWLAYLACLIFSFIPSFLSYGLYLVALFLGFGLYIAYLLASAILLGGDVLPEWILFDD